MLSSAEFLFYKPTPLRWHWETTWTLNVFTDSSPPSHWVIFQSCSTKIVQKTMHSSPIRKSQLSIVISFHHNLRLFFWFHCSYRIKLCSAMNYFAQQDFWNFIVFGHSLKHFLWFFLVLLNELCCWLLHLFLQVQLMYSFSWQSFQAPYIIPHWLVNNNVNIKCFCS